MKTAEEQIQFFVDFASRDLSIAREGDLLNLRDDLGELLVGNGFYQLEPPFLRDYQIEDFHNLQEEIRAFFNQLVESRKPQSQGKQFTVQYNFFPSFISNHAIIQHTGAVRDLCIVLLGFLLHLRPLDRLQRCPAPTCSKIFWKIKKQRFCSDRCARRIYMRKYRNPPEVRDKEAEESKRRYKKRLNKLFPGKKIRVQRRKRTAK